LAAKRIPSAAVRASMARYPCADSAIRAKVRICSSCSTTRTTGGPDQPHEVGLPDIANVGVRRLTTVSVRFRRAYAVFPVDASVDDVERTGLDAARNDDSGGHWPELCAASMRPPSVTPRQAESSNQGPSTRRRVPKKEEARGASGDTLPCNSSGRRPAPLPGEPRAAQPSPVSDCADGGRRPLESQEAARSGTRGTRAGARSAWMQRTVTPPLRGLLRRSAFSRDLPTWEKSRHRGAPDTPCLRARECRGPRARPLAKRGASRLP
jgi:hypothetical protein